MPLPFSNTTCDIYRAGSLPPAAPSVAGVAALIAPKGASTLTSQNYTHVMYVPLTTDIRDKAAGAPAGFTVDAANADTVWIPDKNGTRFDIVLIRRAGDQKQVLLQRHGPASWPSNNWV